MAIAIIVGAVSIVGCFFGPVLLIHNDSVTTGTLPPQYKLSRGWSAIRRDLKKIKLMTGRMSADGQDFWISWPGEDITIISASKHAQLMQWMWSGMPAKEAYHKVLELNA
jgi:hypothetical protein